MAFSQLNALTMHWKTDGRDDRPAILFSNSLGTDLRIWDDVTAGLGDRWRIIRYDQRGHGLSDNPSTPCTIDDHADDLLALVDHLRLGPFALVGLSIGGMIAQSLALRAPQGLRTLVLLDTAAKIGTTESWNSRIDAIASGGIEPIADAILARWFTASFQAQRAVEFAGWRNMLVRTPATGYAASCAAVRDADLTHCIGAIATPTLVLAGDQDFSTPPDLVKATADLIPGATFELIPSCGHIPPIEQPGFLADRIARHLVEIGHV